MRELSPLVCAPPTLSKREQLEGAECYASVRDARTGQEIVFASSGEILAFDLEKTNWAHGEKHSDGVVVTRLDSGWIVCFVEIKGAHSDVAFKQLHGAIKHFHPAQRSGDARSHGDEHHDSWSAGRDTWDSMPDRSHLVVGIAVSFHRVPRPPPTRDMVLGSKKVKVCAVQVVRERNRAVRDFSEILTSNGLL